MKKCDGQLHNYVSLSYYQDDKMNGDERVGYAARAGQKCVQSLARKM
jgi:hypothetical protein